jgi:uncharacterized protein
MAGILFAKFSHNSYFYGLMAEFGIADIIIAGRKSEIEQLNNLLLRQESDLVSLIGRRRIGKTFLIKQVYKKQLVFYVTGVMGGTKKEQLAVFTTACNEAFGFSAIAQRPKTWIEAFYMLVQHLGKAKNKKRVLFFDEISWLAGSNNEFIRAFDHFWNQYCTMLNVVVVICGSATSWMINNVYRNRGGLHNRVTSRIHLEPFTLAETKHYLQQRKIQLTTQELIQLYMAIGGVPFYLNEVQKGFTATQIINHLFFGKKAPLYEEFHNLYKALFKNHEDYIAIIRLLSTKQKGLTRQELITQSQFKTGGTLSKILYELEQCHFITTTTSFAKKTRDTLYRLSDEYSIFYLRFVEEHKHESNYWLKNFATPSAIAWSGFAFENLCFRHINAVTVALGIGGIGTAIGSFVQQASEEKLGCQIDMLIDRADKAITIVEIKYSNAPYAISKADDEQIRNRVGILYDATNKRKAIFTAMITMYGIAQNMYQFSADQYISVDALLQLERFE